MHASVISPYHRSAQFQTPRACVNVTCVLSVERVFGLLPLPSRIRANLRRPSPLAIASRNRVVGPAAVVVRSRVLLATATATTEAAALAVTTELGVEAGSTHAAFLFAGVATTVAIQC